MHVGSVTCQEDHGIMETKQSFYVCVQSYIYMCVCTSAWMLCNSLSLTLVVAQVSTVSPSPSSTWSTLDRGKLAVLLLELLLLKTTSTPAEQGWTTTLVEVLELFGLPLPVLIIE